MTEDSKEQRQQALVEATKKTLAEGSWPAVQAIFFHFNDHPPAKAERVEGVKKAFESLQCLHMATFVDAVRLTEHEKGKAVQIVSVILVPRAVATQGLTSENMSAAFLQPDLQIGTRRDPDRDAFWWMANTAEGARQVSAPEALQLLENIFREILILFKENSKSTTLREMLATVLGEETELLEHPKSPTQN